MFDHYNLFLSLALSHCAASLLHNANVPIGWIQRFLGHENRTTTELSLNSTNESAQEAIGILNTEFENVSNKSTHEAKKVLTKPLKSFLFVARPERFERPTP